MCDEHLKHIPSRQLFEMTCRESSILIISPTPQAVISDYLST